MMLNVVFECLFDVFGNVRKSSNHLKKSSKMFGKNRSIFGNLWWCLEIVGTSGYNEDKNLSHLTWKKFTGLHVAGTKVQLM